MSWNRSIKSQRVQSSRFITLANVSVEEKEHGVSCIYCLEYYPNQKKQSLGYVCRTCSRKAFGGK
jgi:hypothetical protein